MWFVTITTGTPAVLAPAGNITVPVVAMKSLGDLAIDRRNGRTCKKEGVFKFAGNRRTLKFPPYLGLVLFIVACSWHSITTTSCQCGQVQLTARGQLGEGQTCLI